MKLIIWFCVILLVSIADAIIILILKIFLAKKYMNDNNLMVNLKCMKCNKISTISMSSFVKGIQHTRYYFRNTGYSESSDSKIIDRIKNRDIVIWKKKFCDVCQMKTKQKLMDGYEYEKKLYGYKLKSAMVALGVFFISIFLVILPVVYCITWILSST